MTPQVGAVPAERVRLVRPHPSQASRAGRDFRNTPEGDPLTNPQAGLGEEAAAKVEPVVVTVSEVGVSEVLSGDVKPGDTVDVSRLGGTLGDVTHKEKHTTLGNNGTQYVLILAKHDAAAPYDLLSPEPALCRSAGAPSGPPGSASPRCPRSGRPCRR
ncbi:hypothetical protein [Streptomyces sp. NPDC014744]|uniref:hypothetical protein n=1 Tax=Streptomyces sp. NPDC014744 TaxID=3364903 RepID=UPI0036F53988